MNQLTLLRASAGSGKTFTIAESYLSLLFDPNNSKDKFKQILAVTFTNKATEEMKTRIIKNLIYLAKGSFEYNGDCLTDNIAKPLLVLQKDPTNIDFLIKKAHEILSTILHNYSRFNIKTIDSFAQNLLRNFYFELNMHPAYDVELDTSDAQTFLIDKLVNEAENKDYIRRWIFDLIDANLEDEKSWSFYDELRTLTNELFSERFHILQDALKSFDITQLYERKKPIIARRKEISHIIIKQAKAILQFVSDNHLSPADFMGGAKGPMSIPFKLSQVKTTLRTGTKTNFNMTATYVKWLDKEDEKFFKKGCAPENCTDVVQKIKPLLIELKQQLSDLKLEYYTLSALNDNIYLFGLFIELTQYIHEYRDTNNVLFSNDVNKLLHALVQDNDVSFIYEKAGERYQNFMIDEFQDTSTYQWEIYRPLISNSLSNNHKCLIVGDIKQAIYRWREGNFNLLLHKVKNDITERNYADIIQENSLDTNYRTQAKIISFNNHVFRFFPEMIQSIYNNNLDAIADKNEVVSKAKIKIEQNGFKDILRDIYSDARQRIPKPKYNEPKGQVKIQLIENKFRKNEDKYKVISTLVNEQIKDLIVHKKVAPRDIAIIAARKTELNYSITSLLNYWEEHQLEPKIEVVAENSLLLKDSPSIKIIHSCYNYIYNQHNLYLREIIHNEAIINEQDITETLNNDDLHSLLPRDFKSKINYWKQLSIYESLQHILSYFKLDEKEQYASFVSTYSEKLYEFTQKHGNDLHDFLKWWEEKSENLFVSLVLSQNTVQATTIHKSKGLEYHYVFFPYADSEIFRMGKSSNIWVVPEQIEAPFPVKYTKNLVETAFIYDYLQEMVYKMVDSLNEFYVACTRAISGLYIYGTALEKKEAITLSQLLYNLITDKKKKDDDSSFYTEGFNINPKLVTKIIQENDYKIRTLDIGTFTLPIQKEEEPTISTAIKSSKRWTELITISKQSSDLFEEDRIHVKRLEGTILHKILSYIVEKADIDQAIEKVIDEAWISKTDKSYYSEIIYHIVNHDKISPFFQAKQVINERAILSKDFGIKIPDRVVELADGTYWVLDYKFSNQLAIKKHKRQITEYKLLVQEITHEKVKAGIIYYDFEKLELVIV